MPADDRHIAASAGSPYDDQGRVAIGGLDGWRYEPFARRGEDDDQQVEVTARRDDGLTVTFAVPAYVSRGDEIHQVASVVIGARERMERSKGLGA
jgi:hypothetical protein